jgi:hypothetical protein
MQEFVKRFDRKRGHNGEKKLVATLAEFPGTFRVYGIDRGPSGERFHVEFKTTDREAAEQFLEGLTDGLETIPLPQSKDRSNLQPEMVGCNGRA